MTSEPQRFVCPSCFRPLDGPGKESDINYREADHALVLRLGCHHCKEAVFIAVPPWCQLRCKDWRARVPVQAYRSELNEVLPFPFRPTTQRRCGWRTPEQSLSC